MLTARLLNRARPIRLDEMLKPDRNSFAIVRLIAAFSVLVSHCFFLQSGSAASEPLYTSTGYPLGAYAVQVFFVLSGILVSQSLMRAPSLIDFASARALRIFPALIVCVLAVSLLLGPALSSLSIADYFRNGALYSYLAKTLSLATGAAELPRLFSENPVPGAVNLSLWTLKYEVICYALVAIVGGSLLKYGTRLTLTGAVLGAWIGVMIFLPPGLGKGNTVIENTHYFLLFFGVGASAYLARRILRVSVYGVVLLALAFAVTIGTKWITVTAALCFGYAAIYVASIDLGPVRLFANRYDLSYGTYIYGVPVTQSLLVLDPTLGVWPLIALTAVIVLPLALLSWIFIERPAQAFRPRIGHFLTGLRQPTHHSPRSASIKQEAG